MKLPVLSENQAAAAAGPWYADGLDFTCTQCGNCCTGGPGYVWISKDEIARLADHLKITPQETVERYCRKIDGQFSLKEQRSAAGLYDCVFLKDVPVARRDGEGNEVLQTMRACSVYAVRPLQCRTWPFWPENLSSEGSWNRAAKRCHGMNAPGRAFSLPQIHAVRDAAEWPANPPTSKQKPQATRRQAKPLMNEPR